MPYYSFCTYYGTLYTGVGLLLLPLLAFSLWKILLLILITYLIRLIISLISSMSQDGGSGYRTYIFEESIRRCAIDRKGQGRKEVIYLRVADVSYTRGVHKSIKLSYRGPCGGVP